MAVFGGQEAGPADMFHMRSTKTLFLGVSTALVLMLSGCGSDNNNSTPPPAATTVDYIDYLGETRTAPITAAAAEYHTGKGIGETLFDSADQKCQNCHNELYDTWKGSMHGKSWTDPIFQSKFQDFLRTHLNKIGEDKTGDVGVDGITGIVYSETKFKGVAQTCIKCHAPGAYYAGDVNVTLTKLKEGSVSTQDLVDAKAAHEVSAPTGQTVVVASNKVNDVLYKATFQITHEANLEGINCAFCHSIETPRLMGLANDNDQYTLKDHLRVGPHGAPVAAAGDVLGYDVNASDPDMNKFFRLWGPEKYSNYANTPKDATDFDLAKAKDGRYTMTSKNEHNATNTHYTGGPFYGPFGVSGKANENSDDTTDRLALVNPHFDKDNNNHFGNNGKSLCLSCHQRSAGAKVPTGEDGAGEFMELCSTQMAVTTGSDTPADDTLSSPKCQKCHMERIEGVLLHKWADPDGRFVASDFDAYSYPLTPELDGDDTTIAAGENPQRDGWYNSHAFLGASKTGHKTSVTAKIKSGFAATLDAVQTNNSTVTVTTTLQNKTAHMFPGAHPMRRTLTRVIVRDANGTGVMVPYEVTSTGDSSFGDIENTVQPLAGKTLHISANAAVGLNGVVAVNDAGSAGLTFPGKVPDLNGSVVVSQKFSGQKLIIAGTDSTITSQTVTNGVTEGNVTNAAIVTDSNLSTFTRIYGHETGKKYDTTGDTVKDTFVVRPGFDSNMVASDTRLSPNETETYTLTYDTSGAAGLDYPLTVTYKVYYMQKGANGKFITDDTGFLDQAASDAKKLLVTEVYTATETITAP